MTEITDPAARLQARYDTDPDALAWARTKVQHQLDRLAALEGRAAERGKADLAAGLSMARRSTGQMLLGGEGCVVGAFDERRPSMFASPQAADEEAAAAALAPLVAAVREERARLDAELRAAGRREGLLEGAAAIQAAIDGDRAKFPARSNDRAALGGARQIVLGLIDQEAPPEQTVADTLPDWLCQRFGGLAPALRTRDFWEHEAAAVRRAVERGGFKNATTGAEQ